MKATDALWKRYQFRVDEGIAEEERQRRRTADQLHEDYIYLENRVEKLTLICRAMWEILSASNDWDDGKLFSKVKEIDALDGIMGVAADNSAIQFRLLNRSKGPAVRGPRAQIDRSLYRKTIQGLAGELENLRARHETAGRGETSGPQD